MKITVPAAQVKQGKLSLYTTSLTVAQIMQEGFYRIDHLEAKNPDKGYQRVLQDTRAKKLGDYIIDGQETEDAFLPTSVFLATENNIEFNAENNTITFDIDKIGGFSVVDGQHRIEGLKKAKEALEKAVAKGDESAIKTLKSVLAFQVPVNIAYKLSYVAQMCHFYIVNTKQKSVDKAIGQQIISRLSARVGVKDTMTLPKEIQRMVDKGDVKKSLKIVEFLNETKGSPWKGKIKMANQLKKENPNTITNQGSFVNAIDKYVMVSNHQLLSIEDVEMQRQVFLNYWIAIANLLAPKNGAETVLYKYGGVLFFSMFSHEFFRKLSNNKDYRVKTMETYLKTCFDNMVGGEYDGVGTTEWWLSKTGQAGALNAGLAKRICATMTTALNKYDGDIIV